MWKGGSIMNLPELTHEEEVNLERFANLMIELIEKHADAVDKDEMMAKLNKISGARDKNLASFYVWQIVPKYRNALVKCLNAEIRHFCV